MLGKIFNKGKKKEFYLSIDETQETVSAVIDETKETVAAATEAVTETVTKVTESLSSPEENGAAKTKSESKATTNKASKKTQGKKSQTTASKQEPVKQPVASSASSWEEPFWVKAMYKNAGSNSESASGETSQKTFATDYLIVQSSSRRRPGPSLNKFKEMVNKKKF